MLKYPVINNEELRSTPREQNSVDIQLLHNPFPGLRPFSLDECHLFFGREEQIDDILSKLSKNRFITILGYSGSGKSSLMTCGLLPMLYGGFMTNPSPYWKVVVTRPGVSPIDNLTTSIVNLLIKDGVISEDDLTLQKTIISSILRGSSNGLVEISRYLLRSLNENIFFLIDQFEELFKYKESVDLESQNESTQYVNLILNTIQQTEVPVYIAINMRADFIGNCSEFSGLTTLINRSNYLVPKMTREQKRKIIEGPVSVGGGKISSRLVKRVLSDIGDNQDQLPILQHALMRTWDYWVHNHELDEPMDLRHYNAIGQLSQALSLHANEAYNELSSAEKNIAEVLFKAITEKSQEKLGTRRPVKISVIAQIAQVSDDEVIQVVEKFRQSGRSFLMPAHPTLLKADTFIELSHESLMRIWNRLSGWVDEEYESARMYKRLSDASAMYQVGKTSLWRPPDLQLALNWQKKQQPTRIWAQRYDPAFERAKVFLDTSRITFEAELKSQEMLQRRMLRRARLTNIILAIALLISIGFFFYGLMNNFQMKKEKQIAEQAKIRSEAQTIIANNQTNIANQAKKQLEYKNAELIESERQLKKSLEDTRLANLYAIEKATLAEKQTKIAILSREKEKAANNEAQIQKAAALKNLARADRLYYLQVAQSLVSKSENIEDKVLAGLTSMQGYLYHTRYQGNKYDPYIFRGLYYALAKLTGYNYNAIKMPGGLRNKMFALTVSKKSDKFYTSGNDGRIIEGDYITLKPQQIIDENSGHPNRVLALSYDEKYLVNGGDSSELEVYDLATQKKSPLRVKAHTRSITDIKFVTNQPYFYSTSVDRTIRLTSCINGQSNVVLTLPFYLTSMDISSNGEWIIGATNTEKLVLINTKEYTYKEIISEGPNRILSVAFHPLHLNVVAYGIEVVDENKTITKGTVKILNMATRKTKLLSGHSAGVSDIEYSPDGNLLASAGLDKKLQLWVVDHEENLPIIMDNNNGSVWKMAFAKGSNYLIASCNNGEIRVYNTNSRSLAERVCPNLSRNMTKDEWRVYVGDSTEYESTCRSLLIKEY